MNYNGLRGQPNQRYKGLIALVILTQLLALTLAFGGGGVAQAEGFVDNAFEEQWRATDEAVAKGQVSRTYFWGPEPFAHTNEVYSDAPEGQRRVQYFDKARMEVSKKLPNDPTTVTNGLLTVELVTGQMQVGNSKFLLRQPATNPVAGDQVGNAAAPSYASFNQGKLAFGVPGAKAATNRAGQVVEDAVNSQGQVSRLERLPSTVKYSRYFQETGHNLADVFDRFFQAAPLGEDKWLAVMGLPVSEPFWAKDKVTVGGQQREVLIQLFQRRALTFTPDNPAAFQVEMGNIGQHYYVWRYSFEVRDTLPGNYRAFVPQGKTLLSISTRNAQDRISIADLPDPITGLWALNEGRAIVATANNTYLVDLTRRREVGVLPLPAGLSKTAIVNVTPSSDGRWLAVQVSQQAAGNDFNTSFVQVYEMGTLASNNLQVLNNFTVFDKVPSSQLVRVGFSANSRYLVNLESIVGQVNEINVFELNNRTTKTMQVAAKDQRFRAEWVGKSEQLLISRLETLSAGKVLNPSSIALGYASTGAVSSLLQTPNLRQATPSPDGNYFVIMSDKPEANNFQYNINTFSFRALANPGVALFPLYEQGTGGRTSAEPTIEGWSADGTLLMVRSSAGGTAGANTADAKLVSLATGSVFKGYNVAAYYLSFNQLTLVGAVQVLRAKVTYNGPERPTEQVVEVQNLDGSEALTLYSFNITLGELNNGSQARLAQVVQVPRS